MSYRIRYDHGRKRNCGRDNKLLPLAILLLMLALTNIVYTISGNLSAMRYRLMPWTRQDVQEAYAVFCDDLAEGKPLSNSLEAFCEVILHLDEKNVEETS